MKEKPMGQNYTQKPSMKSKIVPSPWNGKGSRICLTHAYFLTESEHKYAYKLCACKNKKKHVFELCCFAHLVWTHFDCKYSIFCINV